MGDLQLTLKDLIEAVKTYCDHERHPSLTRLSVSDLYALRDVDSPQGSTVCGSWMADDNFPNHELPGVYVVLSEALDVLYVGRAIYPVSYRLLQHFPEDLGGRPAIPGKWPKTPAFIVTVCDPESDKSYRVASLEAFLIRQLSPPVNKQGKE